MRKRLLVMAFGMFSTAAMAAGEHAGQHAEQGDARVDRTISFEAGDMWFTPGKLDIEPGETVKFEIANTGNLEHEFVIGDAQAQEAHRKMMQEMGAAGHGGHGDHHGHDMAEGEHGGQMPSVTIAPGETTTLVWTAPAEVDSLEFACNLPGHYESGMSGMIDIQG
ncbi:MULTISPECIES: cupredoxin domain-containing protein [Halomonas]|uniref:Plastocyanin/azurin family copper-binding protein n=1 Tax=Halomonas flagellata TaxID=2920385 RepID=A0ABS9RST9_9GAMM|nr:MULTISPECIES: plastocyanin/azurin family copper-binding protein [Halomonas]MCH4562918.1 plastocyanin/azurin family copper-binding protein [Halomonas flagellata]PXX96488.1 copper-binding protein [Halomonas sp. LBP4]